MECYVALFVMLVLSSLLPVCTGGMPISGNQTILSSGKSFALGFFSPVNSTQSYLGIWYNKISIRTFVWVANRETPLDSPGVFTLGRDGNLVVLDSIGNVIWSSNVSITSFAINHTVGVSDDGNLVLSNGEETLWQSFDHPTDTLLPGMKISFNRNTGQQRRLTSWASTDNPRPGQFSVGMDPNGSRQIFIWNKSSTYWRSAVYNGDGSMLELRHRQMKGTLYYVIFTLSFDGEETYFTFSVSVNSRHCRFILTSNGKIEALVWRKSTNTWQVYWEEPITDCDFYGHCGPSGACDIKDLQSPCKCLNAFKPKKKEEWEMGNWTGGCIRRKPLRCDKGEGFLKFKMKLPDHSVSLGNKTANECETECSKNCSCTAYSYAKVSEGTTVSCLIWFGDLIDLVENHNVSQDLYIRVDGSELGGSHNFISKIKQWLSIAVGVVTAGLLISTFAFLLWRKRLAKQEREEGRIAELNCNIAAGDGENNSELPLFSLKRILAATDNFSENKKLGEGGFGPVYKGILPNNQEVAIKRLSKKSEQGFEEFMNELRLIAKLQHRNLVRLLGCCVERDEKILIYEYMPNRSLDKFLFDISEKANLDWSKRHKIIEGIAQGLLYNHTYSRLKVIHRDLKASNILLDGEMNPKISDFGMARIFEINQREANTNRVMGTYGYMSPEYVFYGRFSEKSDVFSFGVLLLEIVSGKKNTDLHYPELSLTLLSWAWELWKEGRGVDLIDPSISDTCCPLKALKCIHVGLLCVQEDLNDRPTMSSVVFMLGNETTSLPFPKEPAFFTHNTVTSSRYSNNDLTISLPEAR